MFDLFRSRAKAVRYLLGGLLMLVAISMVVTLIPGFGTNGSSRDQIVAEIGKEVISLREVQLEVQRAQRNKAFQPEMAQVYVPQIVDRMITDRAFAYEAGRQGFQVTEADLALAIRASIPQLYQDGNFVGKEVYAGFLAQQNLSIPEFEATIRRQLLAMKLQGLAMEGVIVTSAEIEQEFRRRNDKVKLEYIALTAAKYRSQVSVSPEEIRAYFEKNRSAYQSPEKRGFAMLVIDEAKVGQKMTVPEGELRRMYEARKEEFRIPERVKVRHILLKTTGKPAEEIPKLQARAEELLKQIKAGADLGELARKNSEDTGSASKGGDLGWIVRGQTVKAFEETAFSQKPKQISNVVKTEYGFHILQVLEKEDARLKPFEEVKDQLAQERKRQAVFETMQRLADQAHDELAKTPLETEQIGRRLDIQYVKVGKIGYSDPIPEIGASKEVMEAVGSLQKGQVTPVIQAQGNKLVVAVLTDIFPAAPSELAEVANEIKDQLLSEKAAQLLQQRAREAFDKAKSLNGDLKKVAQAMGLEVKTTQDFGADGAADGIGPASTVSDAFTQPVGAVLGPVTAGEQQIVYKVASKTPPDLSKLAEQRSDLVSALKSRKANSRMELFEDSLRAALIRQGKVKIHQDVINRLVGSYRS
jgi:peptidyl-prolyl cis-trans isomerase D